MNNIIESTQRKFLSIILIVVMAVILTTWSVLQVVNSTQIGTAATVSEVHETASNNKELTEYIASQQKYEAHFVNLTTSIKKQEQRKLTVALAATALITTILGGIAALVASKKLMKPVAEAYDSQERFLQDAAHELRNPLATMSVALQQAQSHAPSPALMKTFHRQTKRLVSINEDLLFLERRTEQMPQVINLSDLFEDVIEEALPLAQKKSIKITHKTDPSISKKMITGDYVRMLKNVIDNAVKYSPENSTVTVKQSVIKRTITIEVKDPGIGIPAAELTHIGERFYRAKNVGITDGTGLGLAIVKKILNRYKGSINITSTSQKGTTVVVSVPL
jgi:two-component system, OmpR family, sensor histidine kinase CiaH